jgi:transposase
MKRFIEGQDRSQTTLLPDCIDDYVDGDNPVRAIDAFVGILDLAALGFDVAPEATGRPGYHPSTMLKLYLYGYFNQVQSSRRLERECARLPRPDFELSRPRGVVARTAGSPGKSVF